MYCDHLRAKWSNILHSNSMKDINNADDNNRMYKLQQYLVSNK